MRINKIYLTSTLQDIGGTYGIWVQLVHISDHFFMFISLIFSATSNENTRYFFNKDILNNP